MLAKVLFALGLASVKLHTPLFIFLFALSLSLILLALS